MPTRKQRRRDAKSKRHEYEFVYVDDEGNELDVPEQERGEEKPARAERRNGTKPDTKAKAKQPQQRGGRAARTPPAPSWQRAARRALMLGVVVLVLFAATSKGHYTVAIPLAVVYTIVFIPFTYWIDRFAYRRYLARQAGDATKKKR